jgi:hypothetical protein
MLIIKIGDMSSMRQKIEQEIVKDFNRYLILQTLFKPMMEGKVKILFQNHLVRKIIKLQINLHLQSKKDMYIKQNLQENQKII